MCDLILPRKTFTLQYDGIYNKIILIGGVGMEKGKCLASCEILDLNSGTTMILGDLNRAR